MGDIKKHKYFGLVLLLTLLVVSTYGYNSEANKDEVSTQEMNIKGIAFDQNLQTPVVLLTDKEQNSILPIWIGLCEARSIELGLSEKVAPRPLMI